MNDLTVVTVFQVRHCEGLEISTDKSSKMLIIYGIASCVTRVVAAPLCDLNRVDPVYVFQSGMTFAGFSVLLFGVLSAYVPLAISSVFYGIGDGVCLSVSNLLPLTTVEPKRRASAFGMANLLISVSIATGAPLAGWSIFVLLSSKI